MRKYKPPIYDQLRITAKNVKRKYQKRYKEDIPLNLSRKLRDELNRQGYKANVAFGKFKLDTPAEERYKSNKIEDFGTEEDYLSEIQCPSHFWVVILRKEETIHIDITSSIYNYECNEKFSDVMLWTDDDDRHIFKNYFYK